MTYHPIPTSADYVEADLHDRRTQLPHIRDKGRGVNSGIAPSLNARHAICGSGNDAHPSAPSIALADLILAGSGRLGDRPTAEPARPDDARPGRETDDRAVPRSAARPATEHAAASSMSARAAGTHPVTPANLARSASASGGTDSREDTADARGSVRGHADFNDDWSDRIFEHEMGKSS